MCMLRILEIDLSVMLMLIIMHGLYQSVKWVTTVEFTFYDNHPSSSPYIGIIKTNLKIRFNALVLEVLYFTCKIALLMLVFLNVTFLVELAFPVIHKWPFWWYHDLMFFLCLRILLSHLSVTMLLIYGKSSIMPICIWSTRPSEELLY